MNLLGRSDFKTLISCDSSPCVSIFLPTHRSGRHQQQDLIHLKNLLRSVEDQLVQSHLRRPDARRLLAPAEQLRTDEFYWRTRSDGFAFYGATDFARRYKVPLRLEPEFVVNERFHVTPLLPLLQESGRFFILAISREDATLYESTRFSIREIHLPDLKRTEIEGREPTLQYHPHRSPPVGKSYTKEAIYHGQGGPEDHIQRDVQQFFRQVNRSVSQVLGGHSDPMLLACVGYLASIYESTNSYRHLLKVKVPGSPDTWTIDELRDRAWELVKPYFQQKQRQAIDEFQQAAGSELISQEIRDIALGAADGRVASLFLRRGHRQWGRIDRSQQEVQLLANGERDRNGDNGNSDELVDFAAAQTLAHGGDVYILDADEMPKQDRSVAARYRYAVQV